MKIAVLPGDGVGPEIMAQAVKVLNALDGLHFDLQHAPVGGTAYDQTGDPLPAATLERARSADAILFGAVGDWKHDSLPREKRPEQAILGLRRELGLFANLRPAILYPELAGASSLRPEVIDGLDILILRELTGDIYFGKPRGVRRLESGERQGFDTMTYTETEIRRVAELGFELARKRGRKLCSVDKANVLETSQLWRDLVTEVGKRYP
ncbi:MAG: 3-isopropylmalate dehydrogenase, partial [Betaproteobacteria bacterium]